MNAKVEQAGFHLVTLKEGSVFLQAKYLKCFKFFSCWVGFLTEGFCMCACFGYVNRKLICDIDANFFIVIIIFIYGCFAI